MLQLQILENTYLDFKETKDDKFLCTYTAKKDETLHLKLYLDDEMVKDEWIIPIKKWEKLEYILHLDTTIEINAV